MTKQIVVFGRTGRPGPDAFIEGARAAGFRVVQQRPHYEPRDGTIFGTAGVIVDGLRGDCVKVRDAYRAIGVPVYILELPRLRAASGPDKTAETRIVGTYLYTLHDLPQRIGNRAIVGGVIPNRDGRYMLVCGQKPEDSAHGMDSVACATWARETIQLARRQYELPIMYRPHPRAVKWHDPTETFGADEISLPTQQTIREALGEARALVTYNSTTGVDAIDAGVPVFYTADESVVAYYQYADRIGSQIRELKPAERETCLLRFAASQWTLAQLREGTPARCLFGGEPWPEPELVTMAAEDAAERTEEVIAAAHEFANDARHAGASVPEEVMTPRRAARRSPRTAPAA